MIECIDVSDDKRLKEPSILAYLMFGILSTITFATFKISEQPLILAFLIAAEFVVCIFLFRMTGRFSLLLARDLGRESILTPNHKLKRYVPISQVRGLKDFFDED